MNKVFFSKELNCDMKQVDKRIARKMYGEGKEIYLLPCKEVFDNIVQRPILIGSKNFDCQGWGFDDIVSHNETFNCDIIRGTYLHYYVKV